jgi:cytochrome c551/c552
MIKKIGIGVVLVLAAAFVVIQFLPYGHQHTNPPVQQEPNWPDQQTRDLAVRACYDCHSNETVWPWYSNIAPVSWLIANDVNEGRHVLNFSQWRNSRHAVGEISEVIHSGYMPPSYYVMMHPDAKLSDTEKQALIDGLLSTVK